MRLCDLQENILHLDIITSPVFSPVWALVFYKCTKSLKYKQCETIWGTKATTGNGNGWEKGERKGIGLGMPKCIVYLHENGFM